MSDRDPERAGGDEDGDGRVPNEKAPANHQEELMAIGALFGPSRPKDMVTGTANGIGMFRWFSWLFFFL